ncbi:MAG: prepilin-type N-terminal cleavage/methylation domain-containing protein [Planctomycetota bacterium]|nr:prepilin-type N-terminal cleavage/methylation domain-containing protein [Planctomycetota bacterium]
MTCGRVSGKDDGFTLVEMLMVMAIAALLMALGVGAYRRYAKAAADEAEFGALDLLIRKARNTALLEGTGAYVLFESGGGEARARAWGYRLVGMWSFEDGRGSGAFGLNASIRGKAVIVPGRIGNCLDCTGGGYADTGRSEEFSGEDGMFLEACVMPQHTACDQTIIGKGNEYSLTMLRGGILAGRAGGARIEGTRFRLSPRTWYKVGFRFDERWMALIVDGAVIAWEKGTKVKPSGDTLTIGSPDSPFYGRIDEVRVFAVMAGEEWKADGGARLVHTAGAWSGIHFGPDGGLDSRCHASSIGVSLIKKGKKRSLTVETTGLVSVRPVEEAPPMPPEEKQASGVAGKGVGGAGGAGVAGGSSGTPGAKGPPKPPAGLPAQPGDKKLLSEEAEE